MQYRTDIADKEINRWLIFSITVKGYLKEYFR
jgi:hypothetical protein